jgi:hypothetical protein
VAHEAQAVLGEGFGDAFHDLGFGAPGKQIQQLAASCRGQ